MLLNSSFELCAEANVGDILSALAAKHCVNGRDDGEVGDRG